MQNTIKIAAIRGAGLSFPIACVLFLLLGQPTVFVLMPAGALIGLGIGVYLNKNPHVNRKLHDGMRPGRAQTQQQNGLAKYLFHPHLLIRVSSLVVF